MDSQIDRNYERYVVYPNEPIDKLTVNRTFERIFEDIDAKTKSSSLRLDNATEKSYGKAKFTSLDHYIFDKPAEQETEDYNSSMLRISNLVDMSDRFSSKSDNQILFAPVSSNGEQILDIRKNHYWLKTDYMDSKFLFMPNGINVVTCSFDVGFNGLAKSLRNDSILEDDVVAPISLSGYSNSINIDKESYWNIQDFINDNAWNGINGYQDVEDAMNIVNMDGRNVEIPFAEVVNVSLRHNKCASTEYSAYMQSYVEVCMSMKISVKSLFTEKFERRTYETITDTSSVSGFENENFGELGRNFKLFVQKPIVMAQLGFYNNESNPNPILGFDNTLSQLSPGEKYSSKFSSHSRISQKSLDETDVDGNKISPVNGFVLVKKYENLYDGNGNIVDNMVYIDIVMKFMAGSMSDPEMEYALRSLNSRSKVQIAMIGV